MCYSGFQIRTKNRTDPHKKWELHWYSGNLFDKKREKCQVSVCISLKIWIIKQILQNKEQLFAPGIKSHCYSTVLLQWPDVCFYVSLQLQDSISSVWETDVEACAAADRCGKRDMWPTDPRADRFNGVM